MDVEDTKGQFPSERAFHAYFFFFHKISAITYGTKIIFYGGINKKILTSYYVYDTNSKTFCRTELKG